MSLRRWTTEEDDYLRDKIGKVAYPTIAKNLNRTPGAISCRAAILGIDNTKIETGKLTANQLAQELKIDNHTVYRWIDKYGLKAVYKASRLEAKFYFIDPEEFWKWAKQNKDKINFFKMEPFMLLPEPDWVEAERKKDYHEIPRRQAVKWSDKEDLQLISYLKADYSFAEIAAFLNRSEKAIQRRVSRLRERGVIPKKKIILMWQESEVELLLQLEKQGLTDSEIAYELGREREHIVDKRRRLKLEAKR